MAWYDSKSPAVDPDNPTADEQVTAAEWNAMRLELQNRLIGRDVDDTNLADNRILVYDLGSDTFVFEDQATISELNDIPNVTISGIPANDELFAYDDLSSKWINQTAAEAGLATVTGLAAYLPLAGGTMTGGLNMGNRSVEALLGLEAYAGSGIRCKDTLAATKITLATSTYAFTAGADATMQSHKILSVTDPTSAQDASTKNYADTTLYGYPILAGGPMTDGYVIAYDATHGRFEMVAGGGSAGLPVVDTTTIVKGSDDGTKLMRFEADELTTGVTRVMTIPDKDITLCDTAEVMLLSGTQAMTADLDCGIYNVKADGIKGYAEVGWLSLIGGPETHESQIRIGGSGAVGGYAGYIICELLNAGKTGVNAAWEVYALTDTPIVDILHGLDMNAKNIDDVGALILNDATELTIDTNGIVTVTQSYHTIDTYTDAATDNLDSIQGGTAGMKLTIRATNSARTVVVRDGVENIQIEGDMTLDNAQDTLSLIYDGSNWLQTGRANNGA